MGEVREQVQACVFQVNTAKSLSKERLQQVNALNQQLKQEKLVPEKDVSECAIDAQDEVRRYGLLEEHSEASTSRIHELVEAADLDRRYQQEQQKSHASKPVGIEKWPSYHKKPRKHIESGYWRENQ
jgi:hypothetical protein